MHDPIRSILIVGGGTAGWMAAAVLSKALGKAVAITLIESDAIGTVGVGEATIPQIHHINRFLGFDENEFIRATEATFKLGIEFRGWHHPDKAYLHAFGDLGMPVGFVPFHHHWLRARQLGQHRDLWTFSLNDRAARANRFDRVDRLGQTAMAGLVYAFHFDAGLYAAYLRRLAEQNGVRRREGQIVESTLDPETGHIRAVTTDDGACLEADFFIDASGFRGLLIEQALGTGYQDWTRWLPCDRAVAVPCDHGSEIRPYTQASADRAGWRWRIPLQHRVGNGHVYCSAAISDDDAAEALLANLEGAPRAEPRFLRFRTGMRKALWVRNCVAVGLSSGFLEPLESTSIHLIQSTLNRLITLFPDRGLDPALITEFNRQCKFEFERIRDFLILHYHANGRTGMPFWDQCRGMSLPDSLSHKIELFRQTGRIVREGDELFTPNGWLQVMVGQGIAPQAYHPLADSLPGEKLGELMNNLDALIGQSVEKMPLHTDFIARHCAASAVA